MLLLLYFPHSSSLISQPITDEVDKDKIIAVSASDGVNENIPLSYVNTKIIGNGSFGVVFQAKILETGEFTAIKKVMQDKRFKVSKFCPSFGSSLQKELHPLFVLFLNPFSLALSFLLCFTFLESRTSNNALCEPSQHCCSALFFLLQWRQKGRSFLKSRFRVHTRNHLPRLKALCQSQTNHAHDLHQGNLDTFKASSVWIFQPFIHSPFPLNLSLLFLVWWFFSCICTNSSAL